MLLVGVVPTPAVAFLTESYAADLGVVLSASHNPMPDNGIKLFAAGGQKLPDELELEIEAAMNAGPLGRPTGALIGRLRTADDALERYGAHLLNAQRTRLDGLHVVVDCANGAASAVAPEVYRGAGAQVTTIAAEPDGLNINDGVGSTHLDPLIQAVRRSGAHLGIAHDGDADRCLAVDATGAVVDGDQLLAICALALHEQQALRDDTVVATVMSNLGFHHAMRAADIAVLTTAVGDRYVLEALRAKDLSLGGEQSGHIVFADDATTGDGLLTALHVMARVAASGIRWPSSPGGAPAPADPRQCPGRRPGRGRRVAVGVRAVSAAELELGDSGRVLLRPSGTEQLVRVMVEAATQHDADTIADRLAGVVAAVCGDYPAPWAGNSQRGTKSSLPAFPRRSTCRSRPMSRRSRCRREQQWVIGGRYRVLDRLGHGGMADVFRAHDELLDRDVAIKVFRTESAAGPLDTNAELRRELELQSLAQLSHPNLITLFDGSVSGEGPGYLVLELVAGRDLASRIKDGPLPERLVRQIGAQLADALAYVHAHGMVHRDVKPANVLLGEDGLPGVVRARLSDFGIVRFVGRERMTSADLTLGTASYIAPEQARGADAEPPADVYSLGLVLIEALTGQRCFDGPLLEAMAARLDASPAVPADLPVPWPALLTAMTAMDPAQRPGAAQVVEVLRDSAEIEAPPPAPGPVVPMPGPVEPVPPVRDDGYYWDEPAERSRRGLAITLALFAVAAIAAGASYLAWGQAASPASDPTVVPSAPASHSTSHAARHRSAPRVGSSAPTSASHSSTHTAAPISKSHAAAPQTHASSKAPAPSTSPAQSSSAAQTSSTPSPSPSTSSTAAPAATDAPNP